MQRKISVLFICLIAGILFTSMLAFAMAEENVKMKCEQMGGTFVGAQTAVEVGTCSEGRIYSEELSDGTGWCCLPSTNETSGCAKEGEVAFNDATGKTTPCCEGLKEVSGCKDQAKIGCGTICKANETEEKAAMKKTWQEKRDEIRQQIKENRTEFVGCVSNSTIAKNDCLNETKQKEAACRISAINISNKTAMNQCINDAKIERQQCMAEFSSVRNECKQLKHNWLDSIRAFFR